jgi:hypothetical protein
LAAISKIMNNGLKGFGRVNAAFTSGEAPFPAATEVVSFSHGLGDTPSRVRWVLLCKTAQGNHLPGDEVDLAGCFVIDTGVAYPAFVPAANRKTCDLTVWQGKTINVYNKTTWVGVAVTPANWRLKCYAER